MNVSSRLVEHAARLTGETPRTILGMVKHSDHLKSAQAEASFADVMADRSTVVAYEFTDPIRTMGRGNERHNEALAQLYTHPGPVRAECFNFIRDVEGQLGPDRGVYTVYDAGNGLVELDYRNGNDFTRIFVDTTPGEAGEQYVIASQNKFMENLFGNH